MFPLNDLVRYLPGELEGKVHHRPWPDDTHDPRPSSFLMSHRRASIHLRRHRRGRHSASPGRSTLPIPRYHPPFRYIASPSWHCHTHVRAPHPRQPSIWPPLVITIRHVGASQHLFCFLFVPALSRRQTATVLGPEISPRCMRCCPLRSVRVSAFTRRAI